MPEVLVRLLMSLYEGVKTRVRVYSELSEEIVVKLLMRRGSVVPHIFFAVAKDATEYAVEGALSKLLYADYLVEMRETIDGIWNKFLK